MAYLRGNVAGHLDDPELKDLVGELSLKSEEFRRLWARHDVQQGLSGDQVILHSGVIRLHNHTFAVEGTHGQTLLVGHIAPGSPDAQALAVLARQASDLDCSSPEPHSRRPIADNSNPATSRRGRPVGRRTRAA